MKKYKKIKLSKNEFTIVDAEIYEWLNQWKWHYTNGYAARTDYSKMTRGIRKTKSSYMHRIIMDAPKYMLVDHINHDSLDNRRYNLRLCSKNQNNANSRKRKNTSSVYKGAGWSKQENKWRSFITVNSRYISLGYYKSEIEAALAYNLAAIQYHGEFAKLNIIKRKRK